MILVVKLLINNSYSNSPIMTKQCIRNFDCFHSQKLSHFAPQVHPWWLFQSIYILFFNQLEIARRTSLAEVTNMATRIC